MVISVDGFLFSKFEDYEIIADGNCAITIQTGSAKYAGTSADCRYDVSFVFILASLIAKKLFTIRKGKKKEMKNSPSDRSQCLYQSIRLIQDHLL